MKILNQKPLMKMLGKIQFDSERSKQEQDFCILIQPSQWDVVKQYCLEHFEDPTDLDLESGPDRELVEEFKEVMGVSLKSSPYTVQPTPFPCIGCEKPFLLFPSKSDSTTLKRFINGGGD